MLSAQNGGITTLIGLLLFSVVICGYVFKVIDFQLDKNNIIVNKKRNMQEQKCPPVNQQAGISAYRLCVRFTLQTL